MIYKAKMKKNSGAYFGFIKKFRCGGGDTSIVEVHLSLGCQQCECISNIWLAPISSWWLNKSAVRVWLYFHCLALPLWNSSFSVHFVLTWFYQVNNCQQTVFPSLTPRKSAIGTNAEISFMKNEELPQMRVNNSHQTQTSNSNHSVNIFYTPRAYKPTQWLSYLSAKKSNKSSFTFQTGNAHHQMSTTSANCGSSILLYKKKNVSTPFTK